jgi:iron complex outermembrane recepter protein
MHINNALRHAIHQALATATGLLVLTSPAHSAQEPAVEQLTITGQRVRPPGITLTQNPEAAPAATTVLNAQDLAKMSIATYGDIFRNVTGVVVNDYGQGGVAYEIKMRGFASGHGRDVAFALDGIPLNMTGSQQTNGYVDLSLVIPELLERVEIVRGPFSILAGNHAVAGSVRFITSSNTPSQIKVDVDGFGRVRALPIYATDAGPGELLVAADASRGEAYSEQSTLERTNVLARYVVPTAAGNTTLQLQHYDADADAPGYLLQNRIEAGLISKRSALSPGIGDSREQTNLSLSFQSTDAEGRSGAGSGWHGVLYRGDGTRLRMANYDASSPIGQQPDLETDRDRVDQQGFELSKTTFLGERAQLLVGSQLNSEKMAADLYFVDAQRNSRGDASVAGSRKLDTRTAAVFGDLQFQPTNTVKLQAGLRWDQVAFGIDLLPLDDSFGGPLGNHFSNTKQQWSPKVGLVWALAGTAVPVELFMNAARGLKSPYTYRDYNRLEFANITPVTSYEAGLQGSSTQLSWRASVWQTDQKNEALFGGNNQFLSNQTTNRDGFDLEASYTLPSAIQLTANYSAVKARIAGAAPQNRISSVPDWTAGLGVQGLAATAWGKLEWSLQDSLIGPQPIYADNSAHTDSYHRVNGRLALSPSQLPSALFALSVTHYSKPYEEQRFDAGGGQFGTAPKPEWQALLSAQWRFQ